MNESIRLGRIAGIPVGINWSVLVIGWLIAWSLAAAQLPDSHPGRSDSAYWIVGALASGLFLASLLAHELAHSIVATRAGIRVEGITLWLFGGVARLGGEAKTAKDEFRIAAVGPATSFGAGLLFAALALVISASGTGDDAMLGSNAAIIVEALIWLAVMNVLLAVFNLIPAAPLDGGRLLRAYLWHRSGDPIDASLKATNAGQVLGYGLIGLGLLQFLAGSSIGGLWFLFLGWFVLNAAGAEKQHAMQQRVLGDARVGGAMSPDPVVAPDHITVQQLIDRFILTNRCSSFPLVDPIGRVTGLVTLDQVKHVPAEQRTNTLALDAGRPLAAVVTAEPDDLLIDLIERLAASPERRALVFSNDRLVGIVSPSDLLRVMDARSLMRSGVVHVE